VNDLECGQYLQIQINGSSIVIIRITGGGDP
jgi:hypothetical protein